MNAKKIPNPRTPTSVRADIVAAILELGARQRARMSAGQHLYNKVDLRAWLDVAAERYLMAELEAERTSSADAQLPVPTPQQEVPELPSAADKPKHPSAPAQEVDHPTQVAPAQLEPVKPAEPAPMTPKSPWADQDPGDQDPDDQDPPPASQDPAATYEDFEGVRIRVGAAKPRAGYVHWRNRRHVLGAALDVGVPAEVIHHVELMTQNQKPTTLGWKRAEKLIVQLKEAQDAGKDPAPLWKRWLPAGRKRS